jgi:predicted regulator of Ras-like GTPase activity (Roadblock/LC7/MglB family)
MGCVSVRAVARTAQALAALTEISAQVEVAVVLDAEGTVLASTADDERAGRLAAEALELLRAADEARPPDAEELVQLDVALDDGSVFVVRDGDRVIAATTVPEPTVGLTFYDLKTCLRGLGEEQEQPKPKAKRAAAKTGRTPRKKQDAGS